MYITGAFVAEEADFGQKTVGTKTKMMYDGSVRPLISDSHRAQLESLIDAAWEHAPYIREDDGDANGGYGGHGADSDAEAYKAVDPLSSPFSGK